MGALLRELLREGIKQGVIEATKDTIVWAVWRVRNRIAPDPLPVEAKKGEQKQKQEDEG